MVYNKEYWENYYRNCDAPTGPSAFALFCRGFMNRGQSLLEVGAGNFRDSYYFDSEGLFVTATDIIDRPHNPDIMYIKQNLADQRDMLGTIRLFDFVYMRFLLHSIPPQIEEYVLWESYKVLNKGGLLCIEARSDKGTAPDDHYRRLINMDDLLISLSDFKLIYKVEQKGLAVYKDEDPLIIRIICRR